MENGEYTGFTMRSEIVLEIEILGVVPSAIQPDSASVSDVINFIYDRTRPCVVCGSHNILLLERSVERFRVEFAKVAKTSKRFLIQWLGEKHVRIGINRRWRITNDRSECSQF